MYSILVMILLSICLTEEDVFVTLEILFAPKKTIQDISRKMKFQQVHSLPSSYKIQPYVLHILAPKPLEGVYLFLGSSRKDSKVVMEGRKEVSDKTPENEEEEVAEVTATVQQAVSYFTSNNNKVQFFISNL